MMSDHHYRILNKSGEGPKILLPPIHFADISNHDPELKRWTHIILHKETKWSYCPICGQVLNET